MCSWLELAFKQEILAISSNASCKLSSCLSSFCLKVAYYSFYKARARATIWLPDVNIAHARKTLASNTKRNKNKFQLLIQKLKVSEFFKMLLDMS